MRLPWLLDSSVDVRAQKQLRNWRLLLLLVLGGCGLICVSGIGMVRFLTDWPIHQETLRRIPSPDGRAEAVLFTRDAGATTSTAFFVAICGIGQEPDKDEAVLVADNLLGPERIRLDWDNSKLLISWPPSRVFRVEPWAEVEGESTRSNLSRRHPRSLQFGLRSP